MQVIALVFGFVLVSMSGCTRDHSDSAPTPAPPTTPTPVPPIAQTPAPPPAKQFRITGIVEMHFTNDDPALVLNYETDIPIEDMEALRKEVGTIWETFRKDVEKARLKSGVIRATHYESTSWLRKGNGYGFAFKKGDDGTWRCLDDGQRKK
jgi:hypothetical protein